MCDVDIKDIIYIYIIKHIGLSPKIYMGSSQTNMPPKQLFVKIAAFLHL